jgi:hypothetical protein
MTETTSLDRRLGLRFIEDWNSFQQSVDNRGVHNFSKIKNTKPAKVTRRKEREAKSMPTNPTRAVLEDYRHGSPVIEQDRIDAVRGHIERLGERYLELRAKYQIVGTHLMGDHRLEVTTQAKIETLEHFWSEPEHARFIDAKTVRFYIAYATTEALRGNMELSRRLALLGIYLDTFLGVLQSMPLEGPNIQAMLNFRTSVEKIASERGLVMFLSKQIPCSCLEMKTRRMRNP